MKATTVATIAQAVRDGAALLAAIADNPHLEARLLLAHALGRTRNDLLRDPRLPIDTTVYETHLARRIAHEPLALIIEHREFWSLEFQVSPATLIRRPDLGNPRRSRACCLRRSSVAAPHTRSGHRGRLPAAGAADRIPVRLRHRGGPRPKRRGTRRNERYATWSGRSSSVRVGRLDQPHRHGFDLVISYSPYIPRSDIDLLMPEVANHEPRPALDGGADGYDAYRSIVPALRQPLEPDGAAGVNRHGQATLRDGTSRAAGLRTPSASIWRLSPVRSS